MARYKRQYYDQMDPELYALYFLLLKERGIPYQIYDPEDYNIVLFPDEYAIHICWSITADNVILGPV